jgi:uncharacterized protein YbjT (DUF2867 family)
MTHPQRILVTGATGKQGGAVAFNLLDRGHDVRALTRNPESPAALALVEEGAELISADFDDPAALTAAMEDVHGVFAMSTPFEGGVDTEIAQGKALALAAHDAGVRHFVYTSVAGADRDTGIPHFDSKWQIEQYIRSIGVPYTVLAPVYFMENVFFPDVLAGIKQGVFASPLPPDRLLQQVAVADIGRFATLVFERGVEFLGKRVELASGKLTGKHVAHALAVVTGRDITYQQVPMDAVRAGSEDMALMYEWFERVGYNVDFAALREKYGEVGWHGYADWLTEQDWTAFD